MLDTCLKFHVSQNEEDDLYNSYIYTVIMPFKSFLSFCSAVRVVEIHKTPTELVCWRAQKLHYSH